MTTTSALVIAERLYQAGCRHAFGMPGGEVLVILQALDDAGIEFTLCKHENAAGFMAEGAYHATGAPGILLTTIGPGLANGVNSVANAFQEQVPLIVISGCVGGDEAQGFTHQVIDQGALMAPITRSVFKVAKGTAGMVIDKAIAIATADPPGPVHIDIPHNLAASEADATPPAMAGPPPGIWPEGEGLSASRALLANARRPILLAGLGAVHHHAGAEILALSEAFSIPVVTTYKAKGIVPEDHPLCLGGHGLSPLSDTAILPLLAQSDCVILAGYDPIEMRSGWKNPWDASVAIDISHADIQHGMHRAAVRFVGDVAGSLAKLSEGVFVGTNPWPDGEPTKAQAALRAMFSGRQEWGPHKVFALARKLLPPNCIATADSGAHRILLSQIWRCAAPGTLLQSSAFCTMGVSVPLAIGYATAARSRVGAGDVPQVVAFVGDAGLDMVVGELATLRDLGLGIVIIVLVDRSLALIDLKQSQSEFPSLGVNFGATDFVAVAQAYGGRGVLVEDCENFENALQEAIKSDRFTVIACRIDKRQYVGAF